MAKDIVAKLSDGKELHFPAGTPDDVIDNAVKNYMTEAQVNNPPQTFMQNLSQGVEKQVNYLPRVAGIATRGTLQGITDIGNFISAPVRGAINLGASGLNTMLPENAQIPPSRPLPNIAANALNLPMPETGAERFGSKLFESAGVVTSPYGLTKLIKPAQEGIALASSTGAVQKVKDIGSSLYKGLSENLPLQLQAGAGSALATGGVQELTRGKPPSVTNDLLQLAAGIGGGFASPLAIKYLLKPSTEYIADKTKSIISSFKPTVANTNVDKILETSLSSGDIQLSDLQQGTINALKNDIAEASKNGQTLSTEAIRRLVNYRLVGAAPKVGTLTLNPKDVTLEKNLAKNLGSNLATVENSNNKILVDNLNGLGASNAVEPQIAGETLFNKIKAVHDIASQKINALYSKAINKQGRSAEYDSYSFSNEIGNNLDKKLLNSSLPTEVRGIINDFASGKIPFNVQSKAEFQTNVSTAMRASNGNPYAALKVVRDALENVSLKPGQEFGAEADLALKEAKRFTYNYKKTQEQIPALKAVEDGVSTDNFFKKYILNSDASTFKKTYAILDDEGKQFVKDNILGYIKNKTTGGAADEMAKISSSQLDKLLKDLGTLKLNTIFNKDEINQLKAIRNVSKYEQFQPVGSAVNSSNTAASSVVNLSNFKNLINPLIRGFQENNALNINTALRQPPIPQNRTVPAQFTVPYGLLNNWQEGQQ